MSIRIENYIDINSVVKGESDIPSNSMILRVHSDNVLIPNNKVVTINSLVDVGNFFGTDSEEYKRASFYFGYVDLKGNKARNLSFYRYNSTDSAPRIFGEKKDQVIDSYKPITEGSLNITIGTQSETISCNFSTLFSSTSVDGDPISATPTLSQIANVIQEQINLKFNGSSVTYNAVKKSFEFVGGTTGDLPISVTKANTGTDIIDLIGWNANAILSDGMTAKSVTETINNSSMLSNNFATFLFTSELTMQEKTDVAKWNNNENNKYLYLVPVKYNEAQAHYDALNLYGGTDLILESEMGGEYHEMIPAVQAATTQYDSNEKAVKNYMFKSFALTPTVTDDTKKSFLDSLRINYYGQTQENGAQLSFYQTGSLMGMSTDAKKENVYINEIWMKRTITVSLTNLMINSDEVAYNEEGRTKVKLSLQFCVDKALENGVISQNNTLNQGQETAIQDMTSNKDAIKNVKSIGYFLDVELKEEVINNVTKYIAVYMLIYAKNNVISKFEGKNILV